jgi:hypothetical protein
VTFYTAKKPLIPKKFGWFIQKGGLYYETIQNFIARISETGTNILNTVHFSMVGMLILAS